MGQEIQAASDRVIPDRSILETIPNPAPGSIFAVRFTVPEFTALCPKTGQPDFATFIIDYIPASQLLESKSLKLYCVSFRNHGAFHEECTLRLADDFWCVVKPVWLRVVSLWAPRGGIPIDVFIETGHRPNNPRIYIPDVDVKQYRGR